MISNGSPYTISNEWNFWVPLGKEGGDYVCVNICFSPDRPWACKKQTAFLDTHPKLSLCGREAIPAGVPRPAMVPGRSRHAERRVHSVPPSWRFFDSVGPFDPRSSLCGHTATIPAGGGVVPRPVVIGRTHDTQTRARSAHLSCRFLDAFDSGRSRWVCCHLRDAPLPARP